MLTLLRSVVQAWTLNCYVESVLCGQCGIVGQVMENNVVTWSVCGVWPVIWYSGQCVMGGMVA